MTHSVEARKCSGCGADLDRDQNHDIGCPTRKKVAQAAASEQRYAIRRKPVHPRLAAHPGYRWQGGEVLVSDGAWMRGGPEAFRQVCLRPRLFGSRREAREYIKRTFSGMGDLSNGNLETVEWPA